jgi:hypothetical protein
MWHRRRNYIDFIQKHCKYEKNNHSSMEGTALPLNFNTPDVAE